MVSCQKMTTVSSRSQLIWYNRKHLDQIFLASEKFYLRVAKLVKGRFLDVSCGTGTITRYVRGVAGDFSIVALRIAKERSIGSEFVAFDTHHLPFQEKAFDTLTCLGSFEHYKEQARVLDDFARVLKPRGLLILSVTNRKRWTRFFKGLHVRLGFGKSQPIQKFMTVLDVVLSLRKRRFHVVRMENSHQFDFTSYIGVPGVLGILLNLLDKLMPLAVSVEPLYLCVKVCNN